MTLKCPHCGKTVILGLLIDHSGPVAQSEERSNTQSGRNPEDVGAVTGSNPVRSTKKQRKPLQIFEKRPFPQQGEAWDRSVSYFEVGDKITWKPTCDRKDGSLKRGEICTDTVAKIKRNQYGRVSYYTDKNELVLTEEVGEALNELTSRKAIPCQSV